MTDEVKSGGIVNVDALPGRTGWEVFTEALGSVVTVIAVAGFITVVGVASQHVLANWDKIAAEPTVQQIYRINNRVQVYRCDAKGLCRPESTTYSGQQYECNGSAPCVVPQQYLDGR